MSNWVACKPETPLSFLVCWFVLSYEFRRYIIPQKKTTIWLQQPGDLHCTTHTKGPSELPTCDEIKGHPVLRKTQPVCPKGTALVRNSLFYVPLRLECSVIKSKALDYTYSTLRCSWLCVPFPSLPRQDAAVAKRWVSVGRWAGESPVPSFVYSGFEEFFNFLQAAGVTQPVATPVGPLWRNGK